MPNLVFKANEELEYRIRFEHLTPNQTDKHDPDKRKPHTVCSIQKREAGFMEDEWQTVRLAIVRLHNGDSWNRALGRQYAFEKVMGEIGTELNRPIRTNLWKTFWATCKSNAKLKKIEVKDAVQTLVPNS